MRRLQTAIRAVFAFALGVVLCAQAGMAIYAWSQFGERLAPELEAKTDAVALALAGRIERALGLGIPFAALEGTEDYFADILARNRDVAFVALTAADGRPTHVAGVPGKSVAEVLAHAQAQLAGAATGPVRVRLSEAEHAQVRQIVSIPLRQDGERVGGLHIGAKRGYLADRAAEIRTDILVVLGISLLLAWELMRFVLARQLLIPFAEIREQAERLAGGDFSRPIAACGPLKRLAELLNSYVAALAAAVATLRQRAGERGEELRRQLSSRFVLPAADPGERPLRPVVQVRLIALLFMFGEQLSRPFLPVFARGLLPADGTAAAVWAGLPIAAFMLAVALSMPLLTPWAERLGRRRTFLVGATCAALGLVGAALCFGIVDFVLWRILTGIGYALMFMACQGFVIDNTDDAGRAGGIAVFVGAIMVAELCAPGIGGILAERIGPRPVFAVGAGIMVLAAAMATQVLADTGGATVRAAGGGKVLLRNVRFATLLLAAAIPAKFALTAFMFYIVPVGLAALGSSPAETGRIAMLYGIPSVLAAAWFARHADRLGCAGLMVGAGGMLTGAGFVPLLFWPGETAMAVGVLALGIGQAMSISPQLSLATQTSAEEIERHGAGGVLAVYRLAERGGAALGPIVAGLLTAWLGPLEAAGVLGLALFGCAVVFSVVFLVLGVQPERQVLERTAAEPAP